MSRQFAKWGLWAPVAGSLAGLFAAIPLAWSAAPGKAVVLEGELQVEVADYPDHTAKVRHVLKTPSGDVHELKLKGPRSDRLVSGAKVRVQGSLAENVLTTETAPVITEESAAALPYAVGPQRTAVILVNFKDNITQPQTLSAVQSLVFGQVNNFYLENSFQTTSVSGNVFGWYTIPVSSTSCDISAIRTYARSAASAAGAVLSSYSRFIYMFPNTSACGWAGYGIVGGSPTDAWINGYFDRRIVAHEMGHNLGLNHAHGFNCNASPIGTSCTTSEYGDPVDTMGWGLYGHFSPYAKERLGWLNYSGMPPITTVQTTGSYTLAPYAGTAGGARALKILKGTSSTGEKTYYYVEYRQPTGFDSALAGSGNLTSGLIIRTGGAAAGSLLLDMTTNSIGTSDYNDMLDGALAVGRTFTDSAAGVSISLARADSAGATVNVTIAGTGSTASLCTRAKPSVLLSPNGNTSVPAGTVVSYTLAVTNNDSVACGSSNFNLGKNLPTGWTGSLPASLSISPGAAASATLTVTSPSTAIIGSYSVGATAASAISALAGSSSAVYGISGTAAGTLTETVSIGQWTYTRGSTMTATATVKNNGTPVANASVAFKMTKSNGVLVYYNTTTNSTGVATYQYQLLLTDPTGAYRVGATATSGSQSVYTSGSFTAQ